MLKLHLNLFLQDKYFRHSSLLHLDLITVLLADFLKDVDGHNAHEGQPEDPGEEEEAGADERDASQPETAATLGEKVLGRTNSREVGYSESHRIRPLHLSNLDVKKVRPKLLNESGIKKKFKTKLCYQT